jgi:hypothetical protein
LFRLNELCLVKKDDRWERAAAVEFKEDELVMMLVDKFALESIPLNNVRRLPANLATGFFAQLCYVKGIDEDNFLVAAEKIKPRSNLIADLVVYDEDNEPLTLTFNFLKAKSE